MKTMKELMAETLKEAQSEIHFKADETGISCKLSGNESALHAGVLQIVDTLARHQDETIVEVLEDLIERAKMAQAMKEMMTGGFEDVMNIMEMMANANEAPGCDGNCKECGPQKPQ